MGDRFHRLRFVCYVVEITFAPLIATGYALIVLPLDYVYQGAARLASMQFRLRTLVIMTAVVPPLLWGIYILLKPPERLFWAGCFLASLTICAPFIMLRLNLPRFKL